MIDYRDTTAGVTPEMLRGFFSEWRKPQTPEGHLEILTGSDYIGLAVDGDAGKVVGFITALTDGVQASFIPLLEVLPDYRGRGIGSTLVRKMLAKLEGLPATDLTCNPELQAFYQKLGMSPSVGMIIRRY